MDFLACTVCRRLCRVSSVFTVVIALLILSPMRVSSEVFKEQHCRARPAVVPVEKSGFKPYHIELYRCSGTCNDAPPTHRPCKASSVQAITLDLTDLTSSEPSTVTVYNHTQCACDCELKCKLDEGELPDEDNCKCIIVTDPERTGNNNKRTAPVDVLPYQIGIAAVGFFALCVLVVDMIMCGKDKGVLYKVKEKCCKSDKPDNRDMSLQNGKHSSTKDSLSPAVEAV